MESALLATREMRGALVAFFTQAKQVHDLAGARRGLAVAKSVKLSEGGEVLGDAQVWIDAEILRRVSE